MSRFNFSCLAEAKKECFRHGKRFTIILALVLSPLLMLDGQENVSPNYRVGPRDLLEIVVIGFNDLNRSVRVSEDGKIPFPYLGEVEVNGLTRSEIEQKLKRLIDEKLLHDSQVSVFIREFQSKKVSLLGAIATPGQYELDGPKTLLQLISEARGFSSEAGDDIFILRALPDGSTRSLRISIKELVLKGDPRLDIPLQANDIINIPKDELIKIYFIGEVGTPGALEVRKSKIPTLLQAIILRGGFTPKAAKRKVMVKRIGPDGTEQILKFNVNAIIKGRMKDIPLKENDTVHVPETIF